MKKRKKEKGKFFFIIISQIMSNLNKIWNVSLVLNPEKEYVNYFFICLFFFIFEFFGQQNWLNPIIS